MSETLNRHYRLLYRHFMDTALGPKTEDITKMIAFLKNDKLVQFNTKKI